MYLKWILHSILLTLYQHKTVMDEGHHKLLTPNKTELAMQVIETLLQIQPVGQVQLLNQGDIEVDFRLVHREGKFAPRLPGDVWSTEAPRASHVSKVVSMINFSTLQVQVHPGSWHYCRTLAQQWSFPEFGTFIFHAWQRLITIVDACMFIGQWANGSPKNLRWVVNARSLWISSQRSLDHFTRPLYKIKKNQAGMRSSTIHYILIGGVEITYACCWYISCEILGYINTIRFRGLY